MQFSRSKSFLTFLYFFSIVQVFAINPNHDASVGFNSAMSQNKGQPSVLLGAFYSPSSTEKIRVPATYLYPFNRQFQIGMGVQTRWMDEPNNFRHLLLGAMLELTPELTLQADLLTGVANYAGNGLTLSTVFRTKPSEAFHLVGVMRLGALDALVWYPDYGSISGSLIPQLIFKDQFQFDLELFAASQVPGVLDFFSLDIKPSLEFRYNPMFSSQAGVFFGLLGKNLSGSGRSSTRFQWTQKINF